VYNLLLSSRLLTNPEASGLTDFLFVFYLLNWLHTNTESNHTQSRSTPLKKGIENYNITPRTDSFKLQCNRFKIRTVQKGNDIDV
jgi:hypothetical protein